MKRKQRVLVAMSGGVDSSVTAALLVRRGYDVVGVTMQIWQESQTDPRHSGCCSLGAVEDARRVARHLGIPYYVINLREEFKEYVIQRFLDSYAAGLTPNPCIECNRHVKFDLLLQKAEEIGCDKLATGHYARVRYSHDKRRWSLLRARAKEKDQSYVLYMLSQEQLSKVIFPLGELPSKAHTRSIARDLGLPVADKPDSQEICFVSEAGGYANFLKNRRPNAFVAGPIMTSDGKVVGMHHGLGNYTIGQRKRIGLNLNGRPLYVLRIQPETNSIVVGSEEELYCQDVIFENVVSRDDNAPLRVMGKVRYNMNPVPAILFSGNPMLARFLTPIRAVTPGQTAVFYKGERVVAGGTILGSEKIASEKLHLS